MSSSLAAASLGQVNRARLKGDPPEAEQFQRGENPFLQENIQALAVNPFDQDSQRIVRHAVPELFSRLVDQWNLAQPLDKFSLAERVNRWRMVMGRWQ